MVDNKGIEYPDYVFCYGTLMDDRTWTGVACARPEVACANSELRGWVKEVGPWGFWEAYPTGNSEDSLFGVLRPVRAPLTWMYLDYFESVHVADPRYKRVIAEAFLSDGSVVKVGVYTRVETPESLLCPQTLGDTDGAPVPDEGAGEH